MTGILSVAWIERELANGQLERLTFEVGVNLLVGRPSTGKTKWLQTLDYLLGDSGENPFGSDSDDNLSERYSAARVMLMIDNEPLVVERRWREPGAKTKVFVGSESLTTKAFQDRLLELLGIPLVNFPKGNPMSGHTWPELSFRMLLRHMYRRQAFWSDLADQQPEAEQHACLLQFLGLAKPVFSEEYGQLIELKRKALDLRARHDQYGQTLSELARDLLAEGDRTVNATAVTVAQAGQRLGMQIVALEQRREDALISARNKAIKDGSRSITDNLSHKRVALRDRVDEVATRLKDLNNRAAEIRNYRSELSEELERMTRAADSGTILADLRITHCPACDQRVERPSIDSHHCFLCSQTLPSEPVLADIGVARIRFEVERLIAELKEADDLSLLLDRDIAVVKQGLTKTNDELAKVEAELQPTRRAVSALAQGEISAIDRHLGELTERQRQLRRVAAAVELGDDLVRQLHTTERQIAPLQTKIDDLLGRVDFDEAAVWLQDGMNRYIDAINRYADNVWKHSPIRIEVSQYRFSVKVGTRRWQTGLGGTDSLYLLMAYHFGLLSLTAIAGCHYPGLVVIDVPAEFLGEQVGDLENFIVQPFIDLMSEAEYEGTQMIITGASFDGLKACRNTLTHVYAA